MAKATAGFFGFNSRGTMVEVAKREDGAYFRREFGFNGFGNGWLKWERIESCDVEIDAFGRFACGFKWLDPIKDKLTFRLPNA